MSIKRGIESETDAGILASLTGSLSTCARALMRDLDRQVGDQGPTVFTDRNYDFHAFLQVVDLIDRMNKRYSFLTESDADSGFPE